MLWTDVNFLAVIAAGIASMVVGFLWYGPVFGKSWMREMKIDPAAAERARAEMNMTAMYGMQAVLSLVTSYALALLINAVGVFDIGGAIALGLVVSVGFMAVIHYQNVLYGGNSKMLWLLNTGYSVIGTVVAAVILALWQ